MALAWQELLARSASVSLHPAERLVLGGSVWLAYAADRWIEGWRLDPESIKTHRHSFYQRFRWPLAAVWALVLAADVGLSLSRLPTREIWAGLLLLGPVAGYLLSHQLVHRESRLRPPKEACVAVLLAGGVGVFVLSRPEADSVGAAVPLVLFVVLAFTNCALISIWEHEVDQSHGQTSLSFQLGRASGLIRSLPLLALALACVAWAATGTPGRAAAQCAAASAALLGLVDYAEHRIGRVPARVLADTALLTPLVLLIPGLLK